MNAITLTRAEAHTVAIYLLCTGDYMTEESFPRDDCMRLIRRLQLEAAVRDAGGWWDNGRDPVSLNVRELRGDGPCPDTFELAAEGVPALVELLPMMFADVERERRTFRSPKDAEERAMIREVDESMRSLAARLGVEIPQPVA